MFSHFKCSDNYKSVRTCVLEQVSLVPVDKHDIQVSFLSWPAGGAPKWVRVKEDKQQHTLGLRPNVHTIHPKFYVIVVIFNTI